MNIEQVREYCLAKPHATEDMPFGDDCVTFRVAGKIPDALVFQFIDRAYELVFSKLPKKVRLSLE